MRLIYTAILYLAVPFILLRLLWRSLRAPEYRRRWGERFGFFPDPHLDRPIWLHAVSVGEVQAALPLIRSLRQSRPERSLVVTTVTPTGSQRVRAACGQHVWHVYAPYDLPDVLARFLDRVRPCAAVVMETEIWPNLFRACHSRRIPIVIANGRVSPRSFRRYKHLHRLVADTLRVVEKIAAQSAADGERFCALGANPDSVLVAGNLKFDLEVSSRDVEEGRALRFGLGSKRRVLVAVSTHEGEETIVLNAFDRVRARYPNAFLIVVPRHPERFTEVVRCCRDRGYRTARRTEGSVPAHADVLVGDTMGEMMLYLAASDVAFVAGSLQPVGGHNVLEPAALALPVIFGPHMFNFLEPSGKLLEVGAGWQVQDGHELADTVIALFDDDPLRERAGAAAANAVAGSRGAVGRTSAEIERVLNPRKELKD